MEQTNMQPASNSNSDRRVDSSRRRAEAEADGQREEQVRQREEQVSRQDEPARPPAQPTELAQAAETATDPVWQRWWEIQSNFVDDPRSSVAEAHALVSGVVDRVVRQLQDQCSQLDQGWSGASDTSTEDLRHGLQSYREFLGRLLSKSEENRG